MLKLVRARRQRRVTDSSARLRLIFQLELTNHAVEIRSKFSQVLERRDRLFRR